VTTELVTGAFATFLEANRSALNQAVLAAGRQASGFDPAAFAAVLRDPVAPIVAAVDARGEGFTAAVSQVLFDVALELSAQARFEGAVRDGWTRLLPVLARQLVLDPLAVVAAVSNALDRIGRTPGARPDDWIDTMVAAAPLAPTVDALLAAGQVAAWRSGLAAYRVPALELAATLDPELVAVVITVPGGGAAVGPTLAQLGADPWFDPSAGDGATRPARVAVGAFRGFGGAFVRPPTLVGAAGTHAQVSDGTDTWSVFADAFGSAVVRAREPAASPDPLPAVGARPDALADIEELTAWAPVAGGFVATSGLTHAVLFTAAP
jgi:hypothetical protein